jgi:putative two-component system response regulator
MVRRGKRNKILVIDHDRAMGELISDVLLQAGYAVTCVPTSKEGCQVFAEDNFDVVILDSKISNGQSLETLAIIKQKNADCPVIIISSNPSFSAVRQVMNMGAYDYLTVPFSAEELSFVVRNAVGVANLGGIINNLQHELSKGQLVLKSQAELIKKDSTEKVKRIDKLNKDLQETYMRSIKALIQIIDARDHYTHRHSENVSRYAVSIAKSLGLNVKEVEAIKEACALHDLGKIAIHDYILNKPGKLNEKEWEQMKLHTVKGAQILAPLNFLDGIIDIVRQHHERYDGKGYPDGRKAEQIYLGSRIIAVADAFDAMTSKRPYRKRPLNRKEAVKELKKNSGTQFDPKIVEIFLKVLKKK